MKRSTISLLCFTMTSAILSPGCGPTDPNHSAEVDTASSGITSALGGVDLNAQCKRQYGQSASAFIFGVQGDPGVAYRWFCSVNGYGQPLDVNQACGVQYAWPPAFGRPTDPSNAYSWQCYIPTVTLFTDINYGGGTFATSTSNIDIRPSGTNDAASSIGLDGGLVNVYSDLYYTGTCQTIASSIPSLKNQPIGNDTISSVKMLPSSPNLKICKEDSDGCSAGDPVYKKVFYTACVGHDRCYASPGKAKADCDNDFGSAMATICGADPICLSATLAFYSAVSQSPEAQSAYNKDQQTVQSCDIIVDRGEQYWQRQSCWEY